MAKDITIDIPAGFNHYAAIYELPTVHDPVVGPRYMIALPFSEALAGCHVTNRGTVMANSRIKPHIMIGETGSDADDLEWRSLQWKADRWGIKHNVLLIDRPLRVAVTLYKPTGPTPSARVQYGVGLVAVQILGDLTKSEPLEEKIRDIKGMFEE